MSQAVAGSGAPLAPDDGHAIDRLREALGAADFTVDRLETVLATHELSARPADAIVHLRRLEGDDPFATLARLFVVGAPVDVAAAAEAVRPLAPDDAARLGLVRVDGEAVTPLVRLVPHGDYYVCSDLQHEGPQGMPADFVPGIQAPSVTLAKLAVRRQAAVTLDLGTGCGIQALLAAKHSERVEATDVDARALSFAAFNARLNGVENVELRRGSGFEPVAGLRFELVVANPPYVISPDASFAYRDSGLPTDELCRRLVEEAPRFLAEGGFAIVLVSWAHPRDRWAEPLRTWVAGNGCDAWLLHFGSQDPLSHAAQWLRPLGDDDPDEYERALDRWLAYLREAEVEAIGYGAVVLRRRGSGSSWIREDELDLERLESASEHVLRVFAAEDHLRGLADERDLLRQRYAVSSGQRLDQTSTWNGDGYAVESQALALKVGLGFRVAIDRHTARLLPYFDGAVHAADS